MLKHPLLLAAAFVVAVGLAPKVHAQAQTSQSGLPPPQGTTKDSPGVIAPKKKFAPQDYFKNKDVDIFPVPIFETRPDKGNSYGLMPIVLLSDKETKAIQAIFGAIGQYNSITKADGAVLAYLYPDAETEILFFAELAQRYSRELSFRYLDSHLTDKIFFQADFIYLKSPFNHFFGIGPARQKDDRSNYTSRNFYTEVTGGYYLCKELRMNLAAKFHTTDLLTKGMRQYDDTLARYGGLPETVDSTNMIYETSAVYDNRKTGPYSKEGSMAKIAYFFSNKKLGSDKNFQGWNFDTAHIMPIIEDRWGMAFRFNFQQIFGDAVPFYELSSLGGPNDLRAFTPLRFVDQGKVLVQIEQRIKAFSWEIFDIPFDINVDPFFEVGRVFDEFSNLGFNRWQPVGGLGFRLFVPPNVIGRIDIAVGQDGLNIYTVLGYPF